MCGIAGMLIADGVAEQSRLDRMVDALEHRGPDDRGTYLQQSLGFGMRRLSIIDVSSGAQPISNEDGSAWIVFNGEIYNYQSLAERLRAAGHQFKTQSDTEVILHSYEEYGDDCVQHLQGMFAFAIWDVRAQRLFIARDRWGIKPLFYYWDGKEFLFSSELKSLTAECSASLSLESLSHFFSFLYFPAAYTPYQEVQKLLPGHTLSIENAVLKTERYYQLPPQEESNHLGEEEWIERLLTAAKEVVRLHLLSEVPLGAFLSGGVDSSFIVALMSSLIDSPVNTFSIGYEHGGEHFDERSYARQVAELFSTNHRELLVSPHEVQQRLPEILSRLDEPFGDASVVPNYLLSEFTRKHVTVALSGLGGDEVCAGYERHMGALLAERHPLLTKVFSNPLSRAALRHLPDSRSGAHLPERLKRFSKHASLPLSQRYFSFISKFSEESKRKLFTADVLAQLAPSASSTLFESIWEDAAPGSPLSKILQADLRTYLVDDLLTLSDRTSMAHSIEMRVPFVDHTLVEFFHQVPDELKLKGFEKKYLLKKAAERLLPHDILYRRKAGFSVPLTIWFRKELRTYLEDTLRSKDLLESGIFNQSHIELLLKEHMGHTRNHDERLFALLSFAEWQRNRHQVAS